MTSLRQGYGGSAEALRAKAEDLALQEKPAAPGHPSHAGV